MVGGWSNTVSNPEVYGVDGVLMSTA
jgi:hypothetical protein